MAAEIRIDGRETVGTVVVSAGVAVRVTSTQYDASRDRAYATADVLDQDSDEARFALLSAELATLKRQHTLLHNARVYGENADARRTTTQSDYQALTQRIAALDAERETVRAYRVAHDLTGEQQMAQWKRGTRSESGTIDAATVANLVGKLATVDDLTTYPVQFDVKTSQGWGRIVAITGTTASVELTRQ